MRFRGRFIKTLFRFQAEDIYFFKAELSGISSCRLLQYELECIIKGISIINYFLSWYLR